MQSISKSIVIEYLELMIEKAELVIQRNETISSSNDFLTSPGKMEKFDAACMLIQVVGETAKKNWWLDQQTIIHQFPEVYWRGVFGCRNIISHEYGNVEPEQIFGIIKKYLPELVICTQKIIEYLKQNKYDSIFE